MYMTLVVIVVLVVDVDFVVFSVVIFVYLV